MKRRKLETEQAEEKNVQVPEENKSLKKILSYCEENNIRVISYRSGENDEKGSCILFDLSGENRDFAFKLLKNVPSKPPILFSRFIKNPDSVFTYGIYMNSEVAEKGFSLILKALENDEQVHVEDIEFSRRMIIKSLINHVIPESWIEIEDNKDTITIAVDPEYSNIYPPSVNIMPWTGNNIVARLEKGSDDEAETLRNLDSKAKNYKFLLKYPCYKKEMIEEFLRDENINIKIDLEESLKRKDRTSESRVAVANVQGETTINKLAEEIISLQEYGCACIITFDGFLIDTRDYDSSEEIVKAYNRELELREKNKSKQSKIWIARFKGWNESIDKKSKSMKQKFIKMKADITKVIQKKLCKTKERNE